MDLRPGVTTRRLIVGRGTFVGLVSGVSLGLCVDLPLLMMVTWDQLLLPLLALVSCGAAGALSGVLAGLALAGERDRVLLDDPLARLIAGAASAAPLLLLCAVTSLDPDSAWPSLAVLLVLFCGVGSAMFGTWIMHGSLVKAPSLHD